jgi:protein gp37
MEILGLLFYSGFLQCVSPYLHGIEHVTVTDKSGRAARVCDYDWVLAIREQCLETSFTFELRESVHDSKKTARYKQ